MIWLLTGTQPGAGKAEAPVRTGRDSLPSVLWVSTGNCTGASGPSLPILSHSESPRPPPAWVRGDLVGGDTGPRLRLITVVKGDESAKGERAWVRSRGAPARATKSSPPVDSAPTRPIPQHTAATEGAKHCLPGMLVRNSPRRGFLVGSAAHTDGLCLPCPQIPDSQMESKFLAEPARAQGNKQAFLRVAVSGPNKE